jgi:diguanylate cyclase
MRKKDKDTDVSQGGWKNRYYEALEDLEGKEKKWREAERLLRQLISRLTLAADTRHEELSGQLKELRNSVRDGRDVLQLRDLIEKIYENVAQLERMRKKDSQYIHPAVVLSDVIAHLEVPDHLEKSFRQLRKKANKLDRYSVPDAMNEEFLELLRELINPAETEKRDRKSKILDRILSRKQKESDAEASGAEPAAEKKKSAHRFVAPAVGDLLLQLSLRLPEEVKRRLNFQALKKHTNRARNRKDLIATVDVIAQQIEEAYTTNEPQSIVLDDESVRAVSGAIKVFFSELVPPVSLQERYYKLEEYFQDNSDDVEAMIHCVNTLAEICTGISQKLGRQKDDLEGYFIHNATRLQDLDIGLNRLADYNSLHSDSNQEIDKAIQNEIEKLGDIVDSAPDLEGLQEAVNNKLADIATHLQKYQAGEFARLKESNEHIKLLTEKVAKMEADSEHLRSQLEESRYQGTHDVMTGISNRDAYEKRISEEVARARRYNSGLSMIVWDLDNFKLVNEQYGQAAGDRVLKVIAEKLDDSIRETDFLARFGGEEFIMLLPGTGLEAACYVAEKLRTVIEKTLFHFRDSTVQITISGGIAQLGNDETTNSLFERADKALNIAKQNGRNRTEVAD